MEQEFLHGEAARLAEVREMVAGAGLQVLAESDCRLEEEVRYCILSLFKDLFKKPRFVLRCPPSQQKFKKVLRVQEPRALLAGSGFEDQCAKLNGHPGRALLLRGPTAFEKLKAALGSGQVSYTSAAHKYVLSQQRAF